MTTSLKLVLAVSLIACSSSVASADILYSNITSSFPNGSPGGITQDGTKFGTIFRDTNTGVLDSLKLDIFGFTGPTPGTVGLYTSSSLQPGTLLESWNTTLQNFSDNNVTDLTSVTNPLLSAGSLYWVVVTDLGRSPSWGWYTNNTGVEGGIWILNFSTDTFLTHILEDQKTPGIELSSTPEPVYGTLLGAGLGALLLTKRRLLRRRA